MPTPHEFDFHDPAHERISPLRCFALALALLPAAVIALQLITPHALAGSARETRSVVVLPAPVVTAHDPSLSRPARSIPIRD